jgi:ATP-dependent Clp protease ATP-binding subunit ClpA
MYPFERFTERAKKVLSLAQEEAEKAHHTYIGTEHLLLALLREKDGLAARVLDRLGVDAGRVRETIEAVLGRNERILIQQIIPTSRVKKVIEMSFEEARRMGHNYVGTEHLLLGLLIEGEGIAAHVLADLGVTLKAVRSEVDSQLRLLGQEEAVGSPATRPAAGEMPPLSPRLGSLLEKAGQEADSQGAGVVSLEHLLAALGGPEEFQALTAVLDDLGIAWKPSEEMRRLAERIHQVRATRMEAVSRADHEAAAALLSEETRLLGEHGRAEHDWFQ